MMTARSCVANPVGHAEVSCIYLALHAFYSCIGLTSFTNPRNCGFGVAVGEYTPSLIDS